MHLGGERAGAVRECEEVEWEEGKQRRRRGGGEGVMLCFGRVSITPGFAGGTFPVTAGFTGFNHSSSDLQRKREDVGRGKGA